MAFPQVLILRPQCVDEVNASGHYVTASGEAECVQSPFPWPWVDYELADASSEMVEELVCLRVEEAMTTVLVTHTSNELATRLPLVESLVLSMANSALFTLGFQVCSFRIAHLVLPVEYSSGTGKGGQDLDHRGDKERDREPIRSPDRSRKSYENDGQKRKRWLEKSCKADGIDGPEPKLRLTISCKEDGNDLLEPKQLPVTLGNYDEDERQEPNQFPVKFRKDGGNGSPKPKEHLERSCEDGGNGVAELKQGSEQARKDYMNEGKQPNQCQMRLPTDNSIDTREPEHHPMRTCKGVGDDGREYDKRLLERSCKDDENESKESKQFTVSSTKDNDSDDTQEPKQHPNSPCKDYGNDSPQPKRLMERSCEDGGNSIREPKHLPEELEIDYNYESEEHKQHYLTPPKYDGTDTSEPKQHPITSYKYFDEDGREPKRRLETLSKDDENECLERKQCLVRSPKVDTDVSLELKHHPNSPCISYGNASPEPSLHLERSYEGGGNVVREPKQGQVKLEEDEEPKQRPAMPPTDDINEIQEQNQHMIRSCKDVSEDGREQKRCMARCNLDDNESREPKQYPASSTKGEINLNQNPELYPTSPYKNYGNNSPELSQHLERSCEGGRNYEPKQGLVKVNEYGGYEGQEPTQCSLRPYKDDCSDSQEPEHHPVRSCNIDGEDGREALSPMRSFKDNSEVSREPKELPTATCNIRLTLDHENDSLVSKQQLTMFCKDSSEDLREPKRRLRRSCNDVHGAEEPKQLRMRLRSWSCSYDRNPNKHKMCFCCKKTNLGHPDNANNDLKNYEKIEKKQKNPSVISRRSDKNEVLRDVAPMVSLANEDGKQKETPKKKTRRGRRGRKSEAIIY